MKSVVLSPYDCKHVSRLQRADPAGIIGVQLQATQKVQASRIKLAQ